MHIDFLPFWGWAELPSGNSDIETQWFPTEIDLQMAMLIHRRLHLPLSYLYISIYLWLLWYVRYVIPNNCFIVIDLLSIYTFLSNVYIFLYIYIHDMFETCIELWWAQWLVSLLSAGAQVMSFSWAEAAKVWFQPGVWGCDYSKVVGNILVWL